MRVVFDVIFLMIVLVRPLMVTRSEWYGLLILLYTFASSILFGYGVLRVLRWFGLRCPCCGTTFVYAEFKGTTGEERCSRCQAIID